ncbi:MAG: hypothetical protein UHS51_07745 [Atopobiaceae bacterium]|nr:hypothetical protein [Atopobiaceae bacterium]
MRKLAAMAAWHVSDLCAMRSYAHLIARREEREMALWKVLVVSFVASCAFVGFVALFSRTDD